MKKKTIVIGVAAATLAVVAWAAEPSFHGRGQQVGGEMRDGMHGGMCQEGMCGQVAMLARLVQNPESAKQAGLTDDQIAKLKDGQFEFEKKMITLRSESEVAKLDVKHLMESDTPDRAAVEKAIDAAGQKELALRKSEILHMVDVKTTLGADTIKKLKEFAKQHHPQMGAGMTGEHPMIRERMQQMMQQRGGQQGQSGQVTRPWLRGQMQPPASQPTAPAAAPAPTT